jgi:hypothetical protein
VRVDSIARNEGKVDLVLAPTTGTRKPRTGV